MIPNYLAEETPSEVGWWDNAQFKLWPQFAGVAVVQHTCGKAIMVMGREEGGKGGPFNNDFFNC